MWNNQPKRRLVDVWDNYLNKGIFYLLYHYYAEDLKLFESFNFYELDLDYFGNHSGRKATSPLIDILLEDYELEELDITLKSKLADIIFVKYGLKWNKLYDTLVAEYNPIENYSMTEEDKPDYINKITGKQNSKIKVDTSNTRDSGLYGFNSTEATPVASETGVIAQTSEGKENFNNQESEETRKGKRVLTRKGNIGVTTTQQMLESERRLWFWSLVEQAFDDVDEVLTSNYYLEEGEYKKMPRPINKSGYLVIDLRGQDIATAKTISGLKEALEENALGRQKAILVANVIVSGTEYPSMYVEAKKVSTSWVLFNSLITITITSANSVTGVVAINTPTQVLNKKLYYHPISIVNEAGEGQYECRLQCAIIDNTATAYTGGTLFFDKIKELMDTGALINVNGYVKIESTLYPVYMFQKVSDIYRIYYYSSSERSSTNITFISASAVSDGVNEIYPNLD